MSSDHTNFDNVKLASYRTSQTVGTTNCPCLSEASLAVTRVNAATIYFVDRAVPGIQVGGPDSSGLHPIVEEQLERVEELAKDLVERYGDSAVILTIILHKPNLVTPVLGLMSEIEQHPELFRRSELTIIPQVFEDRKIFDWVAENPLARFPRIKLAA